ncbi:MAG: hypothetical protein R6V27_00800 [Balneolaceae bacterium]
MLFFSQVPKNLLLLCSFIILYLVLPRSSFAQLPYAPQTDFSVPDQSIYFEAGGNGILFSMNYDLRFDNNFGFRLGISGVPSDLTNDRNQTGQDWHDFRDTPFIFSVIMGNYFVGEGTSSLELGAGAVIGQIYDKENWTRPEPNAATFTVGYRYMNRKKWYPTVKAGITPMVTFKGEAYMRFGFSVGVMISGEE